MLREYFSLDIDVDGNVCTIPIILDQYTPDMDRLPQFLLSLGNCVSNRVLLNIVFLSFISSDFFEICEFAVKNFRLIGIQKKNALKHFQLP